MEKTQLPNLIPDKLFFRYQIFNTGYLFSLNWDGNVLVAEQFSKNSSEEEQIKIVPDQDGWADFWDEIFSIDVWGWHELYEIKCTESCVEGDEWELYIRFDEEQIESHGSNSYPSTFRDFVKAVEELTGLLINFIHED